MFYFGLQHILKAANFYVYLRLCVKLQRNTIISNNIYLVLENANEYLISPYEKECITKWCRVDRVEQCHGFKFEKVSAHMTAQF